MSEKIKGAFEGGSSWSARWSCRPGWLRWAGRGRRLGLAAALTVVLIAASAQALPAGTWTFTPLPAPHQNIRNAFPQLRGAACPADDNCFVVGAGIYHWDGTHWSAQLADPIPVGNRQLIPLLNAIFCWSGTACVAVGEVLAQHPQRFVDVTETWNGTVWTHGFMAPDKWRYPAFHDISCPSTTRCVAVGYGTNGSDLFGGRTPVIQVWNGSSWREVAAPRPPGSHDLLSVSCPAAQMCFALNDNHPLIRSLDSPPGPGKPVADILSAGRWHTLAVPALRSPDASTCLTATHCLVISDSWPTAGAVRQRLEADTWNGHNWTTAPMADFGAGRMILIQQVRCTSASFCVAVGYWSHVRGQTLKFGQTGPRFLSHSPVAEIWNGRRWRAQSLPGPKGGILDGVACSPGGNCVAAGYAGGRFVERLSP